MPKHVVTAIITDKRGQILSVAQNSYLKTHPLQAHHAKKVGEAYKVFLHAEIHALVRCRDLSRAYKILVTRFNRQGKAMNAKPCRVCMSALRETPIEKIEWTTSG